MLKNTGSNLMSRMSRAILVEFLIASLIFQYSWAGPSGEQVVQGDVSFDRAGDLTVINASNGSVINYQQFDVLPNETVQFVQPDALSRVLNRVTGPDPSAIAGTLIANGIVYIVNPAGVYFANGALVNVGGIYAAAGTITNADFLANINHFTNLSGAVTNLGTINGQSVYLIGANVSNYGTIVSTGGIVTLASGNDIYLREGDGHVLVKIGSAQQQAEPGEPGVKNAGTIDASGGSITLGAGDMYSIAVHNTGTLKASTIAVDGGTGGVTHLSGTLDASNTAPGGLGGSIYVLGDRVALTGALLDASGSAGGGSVLIGGEGSATNAIFFGSDSTIKANALDAGDGGRVILWANDLAKAFGQIQARGGLSGGDGGFVETSAHTAIIDMAPDTSAPSGRHGTWLIDPSNVTIADAITVEHGLPVPGGAPYDFIADDDDSYVTDDAIEAALLLGDVLISTANAGPPGGAQAGNIVQNADAQINLDTAAEVTLTLEAANNITLNGGIAAGAAGDKLNVVLTANDAAQGGGATGVVDINAAVDTNGGTFSTTGKGFDNTGGIVTSGVVTISHAGNVTIGAALDSAG